MKRKIRLLLLTLLLAAGLSAGPAVEKARPASATPRLTAAQRTADFDCMVKTLKKNYPYFGVNERVNHVDWLSLQPAYRKRAAAARTDAAFAAVLTEDLDQLHNGHTGLLSAEFVAECRRVYSQNTALFAPWLAQLNSSAAVRRYGTSDVSSTSSGAAVSSSPAVFSSNIDTAVLRGGQVAYLAIRSFATEYMQSDMAAVEPFLRQQKDAAALILDIRNNGGGDSRYWSDHLMPLLVNQPLTESLYYTYRGGAYGETFLKAFIPAGYAGCMSIAELEKRNLPALPPEVRTDFQYATQDSFTVSPQNPVGFHGRVYLLVNGGVFSSSEGFAAFAKATGFAKLVGSRTGGDGLGFDPAVCTLPNSGYIFRFPEDMGLNSDGSSNFETRTVPDIPVVNDYFNRVNLANDTSVRAVLQDMA